MVSRLIADELMRAIPIENLHSLIDHDAAGLGKAAIKLPSSNPHLPVKISLFDRLEAEDGAYTLAEIGTIVATPLPPNMRIQVYCDVARQSEGFPPCQVAAEITRYVLRMVEGVERAEAWQPLWAVDTSPQRAAEANAVAHRGEPSGKAQNKVEIVALWWDAFNLTEISARTGIPYSTVKKYRDELISEGRLPKEAKKPRKKLNPDSI